MCRVLLIKQTVYSYNTLFDKSLDVLYRIEYLKKYSVHVQFLVL